MNVVMDIHRVGRCLEAGILIAVRVDSNTWTMVARDWRLYIPMFWVGRGVGAVTSILLPPMSREKDRCSASVLPLQDFLN